MSTHENFQRLLRPFELLDRNVISASCHVHIYKRINVLSDQMQIVGRDADAIIAVRAGCITSALTLMLACLDDHYARYPDRASIGGLLHRLETPEYRKYFIPYHENENEYNKACKALREAFIQAIKSDNFLRAKRLRNDQVAHILDKYDTPSVTYDCLDGIFHSVQNMCDLAFDALRCGRATYRDYEARHIATAMHFIGIYVKGMEQE